MVSIKVIKYGSSEYLAEVELRSKVLREPLGRTFTEDELEQDIGDTHIAALSDDGMIGCLVLKPQSSTTVKMRQVAVDPSQQGKGIGRMLVAYGETVAKAAGFQEIVLNARESVIPFYLSLGYETVGERFEEVGIPHFKMRRDISKEL
ncbi:MAG: GNAT family N-acetyltransferase [Bdellovibrionia bacterium]